MSVFGNFAPAKHAALLDIDAVTERLVELKGSELKGSVTNENDCVLSPTPLSICTF